MKQGIVNKLKMALAVIHIPSEPASKKSSSTKRTKSTLKRSMHFI
jgi:hypothetical protein